jgi:hypothetical protein
MAGVCEAVGALDFTNPSGRPFVHAVIEAVLGKGTFKEGIFKPVLAIPFPEKSINQIQEYVQSKVVDSINKAMPDPNITLPRPTQPIPNWYSLADLLAIESLSKQDEWKDKIKITEMRLQLESHFRSTWMMDQILQFRNNMPHDPVTAMVSTYASYGGVVELMATLLSSNLFIDQIYAMRNTDSTAAIQTQMHILSSLDRRRAIAVGETITAGLMARMAHDEPDQFLSAYTAEQIAGLYADIIIASLKMPEAPASASMHEAVRLILGITTSTQLSVIGTRSDMMVNGVAIWDHLIEEARHKLDRARVLWDINDTARKQFRATGELRKKRQTDLTIGDIQEEMHALNKQMYRLETSRNGFMSERINRWGVEKWKKIGPGLNVLASAGAIYSITDTGQNWSGSTRDKLNLAATCIGGLGSFVDTFNTFRRVLNLANPVSQGIRTIASASELAGDVSRGTRLVNILRSAKFARFCTALGPVADVLMAAAAFNELGNWDKISDYKRGMNIANAAVGIAGAAAGVMLFLPVFAAASGPLAIVVFAAALTLISIDICVGDPDEKRKREERQKLIDWCEALVRKYTLRK